MIKHWLLFFALLFLMVACGKSSSEMKVINECEHIGKLQATVHKVAPVILSPFSICITHDKLVIYEHKKDTLFDVFDLNSCQYLYSDGIRGNGPNEFLTIAPRFFEPTEKGFKVLFAETNEIKEYAVTPHEILFLEKDKLELERNGLNGVMNLGDNQYAMWGDLNAAEEYEILDNNQGESILIGEYPDWAHLDFKENVQKYMAYLKNGVAHPNGTVFASFYFNFKRARFYTAQGMLQKDIFLHIEPFEQPFTDNQKEQIVYYYATPVADENYIYVLCANKNRNEYFDKYPELQVWNWEGDILGIYPLDRNLSMIALDKKRNKIYGVDSLVEDEIYEYDISQLGYKQKK